MVLKYMKQIQFIHDKYRNLEIRPKYFCMCILNDIFQIKKKMCAHNVSDVSV